MPEECQWIEGKGARKQQRSTKKERPVEEQPIYVHIPDTREKRRGVLQLKSELGEEWPDYTVILRHGEFAYSGGEDGRHVIPLRANDTVCQIILGEGDSHCIRLEYGDTKTVWRVPEGEPKHDICTAEWVRDILKHSTPQEPNANKVEEFSKYIQTNMNGQNKMRTDIMTWFGALQGFLWVTFGALHDSDVSCKQGHYLFWLLPCVGIAICVATMFAMYDTELAVKKLVWRWDFYKFDLALQYVERPVYTGAGTPFAMFFRFSFPLSFLIGWVVALVCVSISLSCGEDAGS